MVKAGLGIGGQHGRGAVTCRTANGWSAPSLFTISGASLGFQIGGQAVDLILAIINEKGMRNLLSSKFELGGDASVAAGPVGRHAEAGTDVAFNAEILTYSRARGAFAGVSLKGAFVRQDDDSTKALYGRQLSYEDILSGKVPIPAAAQPFIAAIRRKYRTSGCPPPWRAKWNFNAPTSTREIEEYRVELSEFAVLEPAIVPNISGGAARASLQSLRLC